MRYTTLLMIGLLGIPLGLQAQDETLPPCAPGVYGPGYGNGNVPCRLDYDRAPAYGPGYGMGPGMMYGPGYDQGSRMGPGMMYGPGYGQGYRNGPGYGPGYGRGPGMMQGPGMGPGMMYGPGYEYGPPQGHRPYPRQGYPGRMMPYGNAPRENEE